MPITIRREANGNIPIKVLQYRVGSLREESLMRTFELSSVELYEVLPDGTKDPFLTAVDVADDQDNKTFIIEGNPVAPAAANQGITELRNEIIELRNAFQAGEEIR